MLHAEFPTVTQIQNGLDIIDRHPIYDCAIYNRLDLWECDVAPFDICRIVNQFRKGFLCKKIFCCRVSTSPSNFMVIVTAFIITAAMIFPQYINLFHLHKLSF